jgi:tRNA pseudouridine55 synthase
MILDKYSITKIPEWLDILNINGGTILIDKDKGWTSFDVIAKLRGLLKMSKIGHAGTLDPLASGLLIVCTGAYTKRIDSYQGLKKHYKGTIKLGATTISEDAETEEENLKDVSEINSADVLKSFYKFTGKYNQIPPKYSAKWVDGQRAYKLARKNVDFEMESKEVEIFNLNLLKFHSPFADFRVDCSKGTYIRSLARDIGESIGCGAYLYDLRRTAIGGFTVDNALKITDVEEAINKLR